MPRTRGRRLSCARCSGVPVQRARTRSQRVCVVPGGLRGWAGRSWGLTSRTCGVDDTARPGETVEDPRARERAIEAGGRRSGAGQLDFEGGGIGKVLSPPRRRQAVDHVRHHLGVSERRACRVMSQPRSTHRHRRFVADDESRLVARLIELATQYGRYGYRRITALLRGEGWRVNHTRGAALATRGVESPAETAETGTAVARRRLMHPPPARASLPCLGVRFRSRTDTRWAASADPDGRG